MKMFKRVFVLTLVLLTVGICILDFVDPDMSWTKKVTYYLGRWSSTSTKIFELTAADKDTTRVFDPMRNMTFYIHPQQANDSIFVKFRYLVYQENYADSTHGYVVYDSTGYMTTADVQVLRWCNSLANTDSTVLQSPPGVKGALEVETTSTNGHKMTTNIYYMGATGSDW